MHDQNLSLRDPTRQPGRCHHRCFVSIACLSFVVGPGCGFSGDAPRSGASVEIIRGKDSAGAIIELKKRGADLTAASVIDLVLGTGEGEIISDEDGHVEFTIPFPAGVAITYVGTVKVASPSAATEIYGTWHQHPAGVFGADYGTWEAPSAPATNRERSRPLSPFPKPRADSSG